MGRSDDLSGPLGDTLHLGEQNPGVSGNTPNKCDVSLPFNPPILQRGKQTPEGPWLPDSRGPPPSDIVQWALRADLALEERPAAALTTRLWWHRPPSPNPGPQCPSPSGRRAGPRRTSCLPWSCPWTAHVRGEDSYAHFTRAVTRAQTICQDGNWDGALPTPRS